MFKYLTKYAALINFILLVNQNQAFAHSIYIQGESHYLDAPASTEMLVYCGTLAESEISIQPINLESLSFNGPTNTVELKDTHLKPYKTQSVPWRILQRVKGKFGGRDKRRTSSVILNPKEEGSYVFALRLFDYRLAKTPTTFMEWLVEDHIETEPIAKLPETLGKASLTGNYIKSIKTLIQVGDSLTDNATKPQNLPVDIVPMINPTDVKKNQEMEFQVFLMGEPLPAQIVSACQREGPFNFGDGHLQIVRTDDEGKCRIKIEDDGIWGIRVVNVIPNTDQPEIDYTAYFGTLTFEIK